MNPYRQASPVDLYPWPPQPGDLVRVVGGAVGDVVADSLTFGMVRVFFDFSTEYFWPEEVLVVLDRETPDRRPADG